jgi:hypothetical protein
MKYVIFALLLLCSPTQASELKIKPFKTDGCSAFPDGTFKQRDLWLNCCIKHDYAYWKGGTYAEREAADRALKQCVAQIGADKVAVIMLLGVRVGGTPFLPTGFRWGYGWPFPRAYGALTEEELKQVNSQPFSGF